MAVGWREGSTGLAQRELGLEEVAEGPQVAPCQQHLHLISMRMEQVKLKVERLVPARPCGEGGTKETVPRAPPTPAFLKAPSPLPALPSRQELAPPSGGKGGRARRRESHFPNGRIHRNRRRTETKGFSAASTGEPAAHRLAL